MKRPSVIEYAVTSVILTLLIAALAYGIRQRDHEIADLKERNAALSRLCGQDPNAKEVQP